MPHDEPTFTDALEGVKRIRRLKEQKQSREYTVEKDGAEIMHPSLQLIEDLAQEMGAIRVTDADSRPSSPGMHSQRPYTAAEGEDASPDLVLPHEPPQPPPDDCGPLAFALSFLPPPPPPRPRPERELEMLEAWAESSASALRLALERSGAEPATLPELQLRLFRALVDPGLLDAPLFRTMRGRGRLRAFLSALRASGDAGARLARRVPDALAESLLAPLPPPGPGYDEDFAGAGWSPDSAELALDRFAAFVRAFTSDLHRVAHDLYPLSWPTAERILLRAKELALPFRGGPRPVHAKALCLTALLLQLFDRRDEAIASYFEAWGELRRRGMVPSPLELSVVLDLAILLYGQYQVSTAAAVAEKVYLLDDLPREESAFVRSRIDYITAIHRVWARDFGAAVSCCDRSLRALGECGPELRHLYARELLYPGMVAAFRGNVASFRSYWTRAAGEFVRLGDPAAPEMDLAAPFLYGVGRAFQLAGLLDRVGKPRKAVEAYRRALALYSGPRLAHFFPPDCPRVRVIGEALQRLGTGAGASPPTAGLAPAPRAAPPGLFRRWFGGHRRVSADPDASSPSSGSDPAASSP
eukprot:tig00021680_g23045.t1